MSTKMLSRCLVAGFVFLCLLMTGHHAHAHASLVGSEPRGGASLTEAPTEITLEFTETVDPTLAGVTLRDSAGEVVVEGSGVVDATAAERMTFALPALPDGTYSAVWHVRSAVDGHVTFGTVAFSIGTESPAASLLPPPGTPEPATTLPSTLETFFRYANYISMAVALGPLFFGLWVWLPTRRRLSSATADADERVTHLLRRLSQIGLVALALGTLGFALTQAVQTSPEGWPGAMFAGRTGLLLGVRLLLSAVLFGLVKGKRRLETRRLETGLPVGTAAALLLTFSLQSHNAALGGWQAIVATVLGWAHVLATAVWLGGLLPLALLLRRGRLGADVQKALIPRFSRMALLSVLTLSVTGLVSALIHVQSWEALFSTTYGRMVSAKSILFAVLVAFGAINLLVLSPKLAQASQQAVGWLRRTVRVELAIGALLLLVVGVLMGVSPAREALQAQHRQGFVETARQGDVRLTLRVAPLRVGENEFGVDVVDDRPGAEAATPEVILRFTAAAGDMGTTQVETEKAADNRYTARGTYLGVAGAWEIQVILRIAGFDDVVHTFVLPVEQEVVGLESGD